jgi:ribonucleoside-diphosphate reductase alpha chain
MQIVNEIGRNVMQGGSRRSAIWAGLRWDHADILDFIRLKDWSPEVRALKAKDFNFPATMDMTNISVILDDEFFAAYDDEEHGKHGLAQRSTGRSCAMLKTGSRASRRRRSQRGRDSAQRLHEVTSADDSDICNLGSINLSRIDIVERWRHLVEAARSSCSRAPSTRTFPTTEVAEVRDEEPAPRSRRHGHARVAAQARQEVRARPRAR